jgi:hypothetical protein
VLGAVFILSVVICGAIGIWSVLAPDAVAGAANALTGFALTTLDWLFLMLCTSFVVLSLVLALGPYATAAETLPTQVGVVGSNPAAPTNTPRAAGHKKPRAESVSRLGP